MVDFRKKGFPVNIGSLADGNIKGCLNDFVSEDRSFALAARINGNVKSAFPDGPPLGEDGSVLLRSGKKKYCLVVAR